MLFVVMLVASLVTGYVIEGLTNDVIMGTLAAWFVAAGFVLSCLVQEGLL